MNRAMLAGVGVAAAMVVCAGAALGPADAGWMEAGIGALLVAAAAAASWRMTGQPWLAAGSAFVVASWPVVWNAPWHALVAALLVSLVLAFPLGGRWAAAASTALVAGSAGWLVTGSLRAGAAALAFGGLASLLRPSAPTDGTLRAMRQAGLFLAPSVLTLVLFVNAATGKGDRLGVLVAERLGLGLVGILGVAAWALWGLATVLGSTSRFSSAAWNALAAGLSAGGASLYLRDASLTLQAVSLLAAPGAALAVVGVASRSAHASSMRPLPEGTLAVSCLLAALLPI